MPGRGQPWKLGKGVADRIGTLAIADGSITEADLDSGVTVKLNSAGGHAIQDEGTPLTQQSKMNFVGAGVTASVGGEDTTIVTIPGGGGGGLDLPNLVDPDFDWYFYDEFFYPNPSVHFPHYEQSVNSMNAGSNNIGGVITYGSTTVINNIARVNLCGAGKASVDSSKRLVMRVRAKMNQSPISNGAWIFGFFSPGTDGPSGTFPFANKQTNGLGFFADGAGNFETYTDDGITPEQTDTAVAQDNLLHTFEIDFDPSGTPTILFKIDGVTVKTQTTNLPSFSGAWYSNIQASTTNATSLDLDSLFIYNER